MRSMFDFKCLLAMADTTMHTADEDTKDLHEVGSGQDVEVGMSETDSSVGQTNRRSEWPVVMSNSSVK